MNGGTGLIKAEKLTYQYGSEPVFSNVAFTVPAGSLLAVVGPNGSGKTTLLRLLAGLLKPSGGVLTVAGGSPLAARQRGEISLVPQHYNKNVASFPATVMEIVELGVTGKKVGRGERRRRAHAALAKVGMEAYEDRRIGALSGGQQQRVMIAQALVKEPQLLLLDEPTSGVDARSGETILELLRDLAQDGRTVVLVSHDVARALRYATEVLCLTRETCYCGSVNGFLNTHVQARHFPFLEA